jgi:GxxExxY protein
MYTSCASCASCVPFPLADILAICDVVRRTSLAIHSYLRNGYPEKVYENALVHRLAKQRIHVVQQFPIDIYDADGTKLGHYTADLLIERILIVELKACQSLTVEHTAQLFGYLRGSRLQHGLLINFGAPKIQLKKLVL